MKVVISGVSLTEGGILSILQDCAKSAQKISDVHKFIFLVHDRTLLSVDEDNFQVHEFPCIKESWLKRLYFEYVTCRKISENLKPDIWISLHDMTPNVIAKRQYVYCHNPSPFYKSRFSDLFVDYKLFLFSFFYKYLYGINIRKNLFVIVQQNWLRKAFVNMYNVPTIVAYPSIEVPTFVSGRNKVVRDVYTFFYPSFPRIFKNFELVLDAATILSKQRKDFELVVTIDSMQNKLSSKLVAKYQKCEQIKFVGKQSRDAVYRLYQDSDCLVFPSKLETWGLPLTEAKFFNKPILVSDLEYAHENIGNYQNVKFFDPNDYKSLAEIMALQIDNTLVYDKNRYDVPSAPFFKSWDDLMTFLITDEVKSEI